MDHIDQLSLIINSLEIAEEQKSQISVLLKKIKKQQRIAVFKEQRIQKDSSIIENVLNTTIAELEDQKKVITGQSEKLKASIKELEHAYNEVEQFAYIASHDLKSPLRTISSFTQILARKYKDKLDEEANEYVDFIVSGVKQMDTIICDLLEYSRVGDRNKGLEKVDMGKVLEVVVFTLGKTIEDNNATINIEDPLPMLRGKKSTLIQLFQNLIGNAIKFRSEADPIITIQCKSTALDTWEFKVIDNGVGMDEAYQSKAFLPFQRLNNTNKPGSGIGLAICKKAIKIHGGDIRYESTIGKGTTFIFSIPKSINQAQNLIIEAPKKINNSIIQ